MKDRQLPSNYHVSVKALIRDANGKILLVKEDSEDWGIPGGGMDHGETIEEGMRRELREELAAEMASMSSLPVHVAPYYYVDLDRWRLWLLYEVKLTGEPRLGKDTKEIGWFGPADFPGLAFDKTEMEAVRDVLNLI